MIEMSLVLIRWNRNQILEKQSASLIEAELRLTSISSNFDQAFLLKLILVNILFRLLLILSGFTLVHYLRL